MPKPETPLLTVDALILYDKGKKLVLIRRKNPPFQGQLALPGGFVDIGETVEDACLREASEETSLIVKIKKMVGVFSKPDRDPRGHTVTIAFLCEPVEKSPKPKAKTDAASLEIIPLSEISKLELAFDHLDIIKASGILK
ncbi:MAG: NUDIX domain-containing protein [Promethearchaeota archaeon]